MRSPHLGILLGHLLPQIDPRSGLRQSDEALKLTGLRDRINYVRGDLMRGDLMGGRPPWTHELRPDGIRGIGMNETIIDRLRQS